MSAYGTKRTYRDVCYLSAFGGKAFPWRSTRRWLADQVHRRIGHRLESAARSAGARADGERVQPGRSEPRQRRRIGSLRQIAVILGEPDARRERVIDHLESLGQQRANFRIADRFCRRRADRKAATRAILAAEIAGQSLAIQAPQRLAQRPIVGERFFHRDVAEFPVAPERGEVEFALVAERAIEARPIHAGRRAQIVERGRGVAGAPEAFGGALQRDLGIVGARPPARPPFRSLWLFLYHFARNPLTRGTSSK